MNPTLRIAGGTALLVLTLAPGLLAGNHPSRTATTFAVITGAAALAAAADPAAGTALSHGTPAGAPAAAPGPVSGPMPAGPPSIGNVHLRPMTNLCPGPILRLNPEAEKIHLDFLVEEAIQAYRAAGCDLEIAQKHMCFGPAGWNPPAGSRTLSAKEFMRARAQAQPFKHGRTPGSNQGECETWAIALDQAICRDLRDFKNDLTDGRHASLFSRLMQTGHLNELLQETHERAVELRKEAVERLGQAQERAPALRQKAADNLSKVEAEMLPKLKLAMAKVGAAERAGRGHLDAGRQARKEAERAQSALESARQIKRDAQNLVELAQYEVDVADIYLAKCDGAMARFASHIQPLLAAMGPGRLDLPQPQAEPAADADDD